MKRILGLVILSAVFGVSGCMSMQNQGAISALEDLAGGRPYVEAYVEYRAPSEHWAAASALMVHVVAKDEALAEVTFTPDWFTPMVAPAEFSNRSPASAGSKLSSEVARDGLIRLAAAMQEDDASFKGCLYPVRARLIRDDGAILEKNGCRSDHGWTKTASALVSDWVQTKR